MSFMCSSEHLLSHISYSWMLFLCPNWDSLGCLNEFWRTRAVLGDHTAHEGWRSPVEGPISSGALQRTLFFCYLQSWEFAPERRRKLSKEFKHLFPCSTVCVSDVSQGGTKSGGATLLMVSSGEAIRVGVLQRVGAHHNQSLIMRFLRLVHRNPRLPKSSLNKIS